MDVDLSLISRLEASAAISTVQIVDALRTIDPRSPADALVAFDGALIATGPGRFVNRAMGVTLGELDADAIDTIERFYTDRHLHPSVELSSWAPASLVAQFAQRDFRTAWFRAMFAIDPRTSVRADADVRIEQVDASNADAWMQIYIEGFGFTDDAARAISNEFAGATLAIDDVHTFMATIDGRPAGCGALHVADGIGWTGGAATLPDCRRRGVQSALLAHRLGLAIDLGCDLVAATAVPSGPSARNLVHLGFQLVQTQAVAVKAD